MRKSLALTSEVSDATVDLWIAECEADLNRRLRVLDRQETTTLNVGSETVEVPADFRAVNDMYLSVTPRRRLRLTTEEAVRVMQAAGPSTGAPKWFAVKGDTSATGGKVFVFAPIPNMLYSAPLTYWKSFTIDAPDGLAMMSRWPDAWHYGTLVLAADYLADVRKAQWEQMYLEIVDEIIGEDLDTRYGIGAGTPEAAPA